MNGDTDNPGGLPKVTIGILSWNRLHYLRATLESARRCIHYPDLEWILSDNESEEPGLRQYIDSINWVQHKFAKRQSHADAMNQIVCEAKGKYLILWPEDVQFIVGGDWLIDLVEILEKNQEIGSMGLDALRSRTVRSMFRSPGPSDLPAVLREMYWYRGSFRWPRKYTSSRGVMVRSFGWRASGICGSGIPSLTRTDIWRRLGPWKTRSGGSPVSIVDSSLGAEEDMYARFYLSKLPLQTAVPLVPVAADIITDPTGCKAKVRGGLRYGVYMPAISPDGLYYQIRQQEEISALKDSLPLSFTDVVNPIGFKIPFDSDGDRLKSAINMSVVFDVKNNRKVKG